MSHPLQLKVAAARRQVRRLLVVYGVSRLLTIVLPALLVLGGMDYLLRFEDRGVRIIWSLAAAAVAVWGIVRYLFPAMRRRLNDVAVAQRIETHFAGWGDQISSAIEFLGEQSNDPLAGSLSLRRAAVAQTQARVGALDWSAAINRRPAIRAAIWAGGIALVAVAICALRPTDSLLAMTRLANPLGNASWPPVNDLAFKHRVERLAVGEPFEVELVDRNRNLPDEVRIEYRYATESGAEQIEREKMQAVGDTMVARKENVARAFDYRADGGDDHKMDWTHVEVVEPPRLKSLAITLHPPAYTGWPAKPAEQGVIALRGTAVEIQAVTTKPLASAVLHQQNGPDVVAQLNADGREFVIRPNMQPVKPAPAIPDSGPSKTAGEPAAKEPPTTSLTINKSGAYWFELRDRDGLAGGLDDRWEIQAVADQPPSVSVQQPNGNLLVTTGAVVPLKIVARDDLAIHTLDLVYTRSDRTEIGEVRLRLYTGPDRASASIPASAGRLTEGETQSTDYSWDLGPLKLATGAHILLTAVAADYLPQIGTSSPRRLTIITPQELEDHLAQRELLIYNELARILKMQQAARLETSDLETTLKRIGRFAKADVDQLRGDELNQRQIRRSLTSPTEGARAQIVALLGELTSNRVANPDLHRRIQGFADEIARLDREELPAVERELTAALKGSEDVKSPPSPAARQELTSAGRNQDGVVAALERMLGNLAEWNSVRGVSRELSDIRSEQTKLEKDTTALQAETLTKDPQDLSPPQQAELQRIAGQQLDLGRRFEKLEQRIGQVAGQLKATDPTSADSMGDAARSAHEQGISGLLREAGESVEQGHVGQALPKQASARRGLDEMLDILSNRREQELAGLVKKLRDAEQKLDALRNQQEGLRKKLKAAGQNADQAERRRELERLSREQRELQEQVDRLARQLQRLQADKAASSLTRAAEQMGAADKSAAGGDSDGANKNSESAAKDLDDAQQQLAAARRKAENDLATEQLARLEDGIKGLIDRQQHVNDETLRLEKLRADQGQWTRTQAKSLQDLARAQQSLGDETGQLGEKLAGAEAFQFLLDAAAHDMAQIAKRLLDRDTAAATQELEQDVLARLEQLVAAMKEDKSGGNDPQAGANGPSGNGQQSGSTIRTMAEVRLIRLMQDDLNRRTQRLSEAIGGKEPTDDQRAEFFRLSKEQGRLAELILGLSGNGE